MQKESVRAFKNELRNYNYYLSRITSLENSIEYLYDRLGGVRGIDPSKEPLHLVMDKDLEWRIRDRISDLDDQKKLYEVKVRYIDYILARIENPLKTAVISVYVEGKKCVKIADDMFLSSTGLQKRMNRAIEGALDEV